MLCPAGNAHCRVSPIGRPTCTARVCPLDGRFGSRFGESCPLMSAAEIHASDSMDQCRYLRTACCSSLDYALDRERARAALRQFCGAYAREAQHCQSAPDHPARRRQYRSRSSCRFVFRGTWGGRRGEAEKRLERIVGKHKDAAVVRAEVVDLLVVERDPDPG